MSRAISRLLCCLARGFLVGAVYTALMSCAPTQGYIGAELPRAQVAVVAFDTRYISSATANGLAFGGAGISLLPGEHHFQVIASHGDTPYGCRPYTLVDAPGFDRCQKEREAEIRRGKKEPRECALSRYTKYRQTCLRDYRDVVCETTLALLAGREYELTISPSFLTPPMLVASLVSGSFLTRTQEALPMTSACQVVRTRTVQEDYEAPW